MLFTAVCSLIENKLFFFFFVFLQKEKAEEEKQTKEKEKAEQNNEVAAAKGEVNKCCASILFVL